MENLRLGFHIVSWNVAGWSKTIEKIKLKHGTFENWLNKHSIDILCIQEVKISSKDLCLKKNEYGACLNDFDSFWAFPDPNKSKQKSGLNGVTTFVKKGLVVKAQSNIFGDDTIDSEGRCIMTDHGSFVVFNVYVPYRGQNFVRLPFKIKFLEKLRDVMKVQRSMGKKVILAGDLNVAPRSQDCFRGYRKLNLSSMVNDLKFTDAGCIYKNNFKYIAQPELLKLKCFVDYLIDKWPDVKNSLESSLAIEEDTSGKSKVYYISAIRNSDGKRVK
jgi:exodeoxyribonuclease III